MTRRYSTANRPRTTTKASGSRDQLYASADWRRESRAFLAAHPRCACGCGGRASIVDHVTPWRQHPGGFMDQSNWQGLAHSCHARKSRVEQGEDGRLPKVQRTGPTVKGCDLHGMPLDPAHPWRRE
jgi:5-methylcytosine-specific restriction enzyme A